MSNYLTLAVVTATIGRLIGETMEAVANPSANPRVRFGPPQSDPQNVGCAIYLYRVSDNPFRRNEHLPIMRDDDKTYVERSRTVLDADYLLTFSGNESTLEPQRLLGAAVSALSARPVLTPDAIRRTIVGSSFLAGADADRQVDRVRLTMNDLDQAAMTQIWTMFPTVAYALSISIRASAIVIDGAVTATIPIATEVGREVGLISPENPTQ